MVTLYSHHGRRGPSGFSSKRLGQFWRAEVGKFSEAPKAGGNQTKTMTLEAVEFIRRFLLHVLPSGFVHIRHFGFLANRKRKEKLALCRNLLGSQQPVVEASADPPGSRDLTTEEGLFRRCPVCKTGRLIIIQVLTAAACACLPAPMIADSS